MIRHKAVTFLFDKSSNILLYGAASIGTIFHDILTSGGYRIDGFMDSRAFEIRCFKNLPVWNPEDVPGELDEYVVIISVKNVFEHSSIAKGLVGHGFRNIIYRPLSVIRGNGTAEEKLLNAAFDSIERKKLDDIPSSLPISCSLSGHKFSNRAIICDEGEQLVARVPVKLIYTNLNVQDQSIWNDISIFNLKPHLALYSYASEEGDYPQAYVDFCINAAKAQGITITDSWIKNILRNRCMIYEEMSQNLELDPEFFIRNPPDVKWNKKGYFNLSGGKHRASFFAFRKMRYMPVCMSKQDYQTWLNPTVLDIILPMMSIIDSWPEPIPHPFFYDFPCDRQAERNPEIHSLIQELLRGSVNS